MVVKGKGIPVLSLTSSLMVSFPCGAIRNWKYTIRIYHVCEGGLEKSVPRITVWHHKAC